MADRYDVIVRDASIVDGTGWPAFKGSVGVIGERIEAVGRVDGTAVREIDGSDLIVCPGFIDTHSHADSSLLQYPLVENFVMQGVTTFVGGNCGATLAPIRDPERPPQDIVSRLEGGGGGVTVNWRTFGDWLARVESEGISVNYVPLVGHNTIRTAVMGDDHARNPTSDEMTAMKAHVAEAMEAGAFGLASFFDPGPGAYATLEETVELVKVAREYGGLYSPHTRFHQDSWVTDYPDERGYGLMHTFRGEIIVGRYHGLLEAVEIAKRADIRLLIAHFAPAYIIPQPQPKLLQEAAARATLIDIVDKPRRDGVDVFFNAIAFTPSVSHQIPIARELLGPELAVPPWMKELTVDTLSEKLKDRTFRDKVKEVLFSGRIKFYMVHPLVNPYWMDCFTVVRCKNKEFEGRTIGEIARQRGSGRTVDTVYNQSVEVVFDLIVEDPGVTWAVSLDVRENPGALPVFLQHPAGMPCADTWSMPAQPEGFTDWNSPPEPSESGSKPHYLQTFANVQHLLPIAYGLYPHYLQTFVNEQHVLSLEEAVRKATMLPAQVMGLKDRGTICPGAYADMVVFDQDEIGMRGDFAEPHRPPGGIELVLVNGRVAYENMRHTGVRAGKVIRRQ